MLEGGCSCGHVRYEAGGAPFHPTACHCSMCRRVADAPMVAWFPVPHAGYRVAASAPTRFRSSVKATRAFCPFCRTPLTSESDGHSDEVDVTTAGLDASEALPPRDHAHAATQPSWVRLAGGLSLP